MRMSQHYAEYPLMEPVELRDGPITGFSCMEPISLNFSKPLFFADCDSGTALVPYGFATPSAHPRKLMPIVTDLIAEANTFAVTA